MKRVAYGYTLQVDGNQVRKCDSAWTEGDAQKALAEALLGRDVPNPAAPTPTLTFAEAVERYLKAKSRKRTVKRDAWHLAALTRAFGAETPLTAFSAARISAWKAEMLAATSARTAAPYSAASINRPLQALSTLLHLAHEEWEMILSVPRIRLEKEPQGRIRWLEPDEEARLIEACRANRTIPGLADIVTMALETGMRKASCSGSPGTGST